MPISVNPETRVISIPQADLSMVSGTLYELDVDLLRLQLKDWEDDFENMGMPDTHRHNTPVTLSGVTYAPTFEIINGYTVTFEDGTYSVRCVGANHNLADVKNLNMVSLIIGNSAGLIQVASGSGLSAGQATMLEELHKIHGLLLGTPLVVTATSREAGAVTQTIDDTAGTVTVERT